MENIHALHTLIMIMFSNKSTTVYLSTILRESNTTVKVRNKDYTNWKIRKNLHFLQLSINLNLFLSHMRQVILWFDWTLFKTVSL